MAERIVVAGDNVTLDLLLWRRFGGRGNGLLARTFVLNPGLADKGVFIPPGTSVLLPDAPVASPCITQPVSLFE